jgi:hypothetical protein
LAVFAFFNFVSLLAVLRLNFFTFNQFFFSFHFLYPLFETLGGANQNRRLDQVAVAGRDDDDLQEVGLWLATRIFEEVAEFSRAISPEKFSTASARLKSRLRSLALLRDRFSSPLLCAGRF